MCDVNHITDKLQEFNPVQSTNVPASALQGVVKLGDLGAELDMEAITNLQTLLNWPPGNVSKLDYC